MGIQAEMGIILNGHNLVADIAGVPEIGPHALALTYRAPDNGRLYTLKLSVLNLEAMFDLTGQRAPSDAPPATPSDPLPNSAAAGDAIDQMGGAFDPAAEAGHPADGHGDAIEREHEAAKAAQADADREPDPGSAA